MFGGKITFVLVIALVMVAGSFAAYFKWSQGRINDLVADNAKLTVAIKVQEATIATLKQSAERQAGEILALQQNVAAAEQERRTLEGKLRKLNLQMMARNNAADLESRINRATVRAFGDIENLTGTPRRDETTAPQGATSGSQPTASQTPASQAPAAPPASSQPAPTNNSQQGGSQPPPRPPVRAKH